MKIEKILNNNVVVVRDGEQKEKIVMGRGIAFQKEVGSFINEENVDKEFKLVNPENYNRFQELIVDIPITFLELAEELIAYAITELKKELNESIYISLVDHIYTAVERFKEGIEVKNALFWDTKRFYQEEFAIGMHALDMIEKAFDVRLPDDEASFIAIHFVNAQTDQNVNDIYEITKVMQELSNIVKYNFNIEFDEESVYFYRFITHLKFFAQRLINYSTYKDSGNDDLLLVIKDKYHNSYECVLKIAKFILDEYHYVISNEEKLYLTIHIERVIYKTEQ